ncbi:putative hydrolase of the HAD superfamily [Pontibacter mucosus]|uniref:Putative hydrolase of the HAD superfamily n=1 Tax=Pontibacter mucosus TaxID=1649266 RepID=A0A2T5YLK3_9BACT|nr:HAD family hydrolase [Pontibacter mucosus]PTX20203.1 putative hydrolase of the HAD superfamily [Pontibacter mucosus]
MSVKALILDLDNTIYPVPSIGEELFKPVFDVLQQSSDYEGELEDIKQDMMRIPFQKVAAKYKFSKELKEEGDSILQNLAYEKEFPPFEDYAHLRELPHQKFLVTTGYTKMQQSKVDQLGLEKDFAEIHIVDPSKTKQTKKDVFESILERYTLDTSEVWVVGDDPESEIKAGKELGLTTVLYSKNGNHSTHATHAISHFSELGELLANK